MLKIDFSQLWAEEHTVLASLASLVPGVGVIVKIGTAQSNKENKP